jgi:hypothetical protein
MFVSVGFFCTASVVVSSLSENISSVPHSGHPAPPTESDFLNGVIEGGILSLESFAAGILNNL